MNETSMIKRFFKTFSWVFKPFLWYIIGVTFIEQLLYWLFLWSVKVFAANEAYYDIFRFIAGNRYALFAMVSGVIMTSFFVRLYREDWRLRVRNEAGGLVFNGIEAGTERSSLPGELHKINGLFWIVAASAAGCIVLTVLINFLSEVLLTTGAAMESATGAATGSATGAAMGSAMESAMEEAAKLGMADLIVLVPATLVVAPIFEELFFRGIIFRRARDRMGLLPAVMLSAFVFGIVHDNAAQFILAFAMGMFFAYVYDRYDSLLSAVIAHMAANSASLLCSAAFFGKIYEVRGIALAVVMIICIITVFYGIRKISNNRSSEYVLFSSIEREDNT